MGNEEIIVNLQQDIEEMNNLLLIKDETINNLNKYIKTLENQLSFYENELNEQENPIKVYTEVE
jgi:septal ring factor EnvC (AmiA/AmiB activator)